MRKILRLPLFIGMIISAGVWGGYFVCSFIAAVQHGFYFNNFGNGGLLDFLLLLLAAACTALSVIGIINSQKEVKKAKKFELVILGLVVIDCVMVCLFLYNLIVDIGTLLQYSYFYPLLKNGINQGVIFAIAFLVAIFSTMIGRQKALLEYRGINQDTQYGPNSDLNYRRPLLLAGSIISTVAFGLLSLGFFAVISQTDPLTMFAYIIIGIGVFSALVTSVMTIIVAAKTHRKFMKLRVFPISSFVFCCLFAVSMIAAGLSTTIGTVTGAYACILYSVLFIIGGIFTITGIIKAKKENLVSHVDKTSSQFPSGMMTIEEAAANIEKLNMLKEKGILTQEEFDTAKTLCLSKIR